MSAACQRFPLGLSISLLETTPRRTCCFISALVFKIFSFGECIVLAIPSKSQPKFSFRAHFTSFNFFYQNSIQKMLSMPCSSQQVVCRSSSINFAWHVAMKSSTQTYIKFRSFSIEVFASLIVFLGHSGFDGNM